MRYTFGPVASRRLGRSLGVDLVPYKTCTLDCLYCECGPTTACVSERAEFVPLDAVLAEIIAKLAARPDVITFSGSGEPTLYSRLGELIARVKAETRIPVAVLTNGTLLHDPAVRADLARADVVSPSLDAPDEATFALVNRPCPGVTLDRLMEGLAAFRAEYKGQYWLEVLLLGGITDTEEMVRGIAARAGSLKPHRIQLNSVVRPPAHPQAQAIPFERLEELARLFDPPAEVIAPFTRPAVKAPQAVTPDDVISSLRRRPGTVEEVAAGLGIPGKEALRILKSLSDQGLVDTQLRDLDTVFTARERSAP